MTDIVIYAANTTISGLVQKEKNRLMYLNMLITLPLGYKHPKKKINKTNRRPKGIACDCYPDPVSYSWAQGPGRQEAHHLPPTGPNG